MGTTLEPLPANLSTLSDDQLRDAKESRNTLISQVFHEAEGDDGPDLNKVTCLEGDATSKM
jgi:hypothetical protein